MRALIIIALALTGCRTLSIEAEHEGTKIKARATYPIFMKASASLEAERTDTGWKVKYGNETDTNAEALKAAGNALLQAASKVR